ncbi:MAG: S8 family serine peptidase, partial [Actinomycetota bacterium]|nr:S8 family serine peptidase [Actinomycetota bacterium]
ACSSARAGSVCCLAQWLPGSGAMAPASTGSRATGPSEGYGPADVQAAYGLDPSAGAGQTVAIVGAYDNPNIEADLAVARRTWGLPACTSASGCFRKVDRRGGQQLPAPDPGRGLETALDTQAVSAACPRCRILLVEADSASLRDIGAAVNRAVALGAKIVDNSYGTDEFAGMQRFARDYYTHPGVAQVVSSGDYGFTTASFPAVLPSSVAVGGTTLSHRAGAWQEKVWGGAGSSCSAYVAKPAWQKDTHCPMRTVADVSAVADPRTGLAVYDTFGLGPSSAWIVVGGTSLSAPLVAGMIGAGGQCARTGHCGPDLHGTRLPARRRRRWQRVLRR